MDKTRKIKKVLISQPTLEGAGVHLRRGFGFREVPMFDPFLMFDDFRQDDPAKYLPGFPWHPHRGIETITYMLNGRVEHGDSMGNSGVIGAGDVQWMTAGSGIIHQEMPKGDAGGRMGGFQLWANLPASHKMMDPRYRDVKRTDIPEVALPGGVTVRIICGTVGKIRGPVRDIVTDPEYIDVSIPRQAEFVHPTKPGHTVVAYVIEGEGCFAAEAPPSSYDVEPASYFDLERKPVQGGPRHHPLRRRQQDPGNDNRLPVRFLLMSGLPLGEPVAWHGPIVMNTQEELRSAFREYRAGTFVSARLSSIPVRFPICCKPAAKSVILGDQGGSHDDDRPRAPGRRPRPSTTRPHPVDSQRHGRHRHARQLRHRPPRALRPGKAPGQGPRALPDAGLDRRRPPNRPRPRRRGRVRAGHDVRLPQRELEALAHGRRDGGPRLREFQNDEGR